ncbi:hypothetical protein IGI04_034561 [Brassica rapa subsp. trilocularis]|uniref:HMA domain-containing protein n=1 Tax=Brassica rapa subsp. trilocularis TaxID=1813537 RepID=A0ABQ7LCZ2_BRACM|nr:hypothetical protein IGI04_034561 [Brassica rapa subsp. trilocularis]
MSEECRFVFDYDDDVARRKALDYINNSKGVKSVTLKDNLLIVRGDGLDQDKMEKKLDKIFSPKKGCVWCMAF